MESPVVLDKPPEYHGDRGFPFEEEEGSGAWSELAARHPDIAARLRQRPATWTRKRRPSSNDATDDFGENFGGFDRFPFDDIPPEFREHFPSHWNRRFSTRDEQPQPAPASPTQPQQHTASTQTEQTPAHTEQEQTQIPQYGLRNTVDLGQKSPADPSLVDADERSHRSMSAPPDAPNQPKMSGHNHQEPSHQPHAETHSNVRHIPIFVEGRDEPVINKSVDHGTHFGDAKPQYAPPPQQPHVDRDQYFADDGPTNFHPPPNFSRAFGTPFNNKTYRQGPQPFVQQKAYPQTAFARGPSPQRGQSPKPTEDYVKVPVHHDTPKAEPPSRAQQPPPPPPRSPQQQAAPPHSPQREQTPPRPQEPSSNDPISLILSIQTDVLNLMTDVENFTGTKKDKTYLYLDEMLTRNLIKLDNIETDGKENIRQARKEAIRCIQKCIAVLEAKADSSNQKRNPQLEGETQPESQTGDVDMKENSQNEQATENVADPVVQNGEVEMKESTKEDKPVEHQTPAPAQTNVENKTESTATEEKKDEQKPEEVKPETQEPQPDDIKAETNATTQPSADTRPEDKTEEKKAPKKVTKIVKKRDKSKDKKDAPKDSNKDDKTNSELKTEPMSVDGDKTDAAMEIDGAASQ